MEKLEAKFTTQKLKPYIKARMKPSFNMEVKYIRGTNYCFRSDRSFKKELSALLLGEEKGFFYKHPDIAAMGNPFDAQYIKAPGFFFLYWESSRKTYQIPVKVLSEFTECDSVKSLSEQTAMLLAINTIIL